MKKRRTVSKIVTFLSVTAALVYIATSISVPMPKPLGVWHIGDVASFVVAILYGPLIGSFACGVGAMLFDVWNPLWGSSFIIWAPATLIIRGFMGFLLGKMRRIMSMKPRHSEIIAMITASIEKNIGYFLYDYALFGPVAYMDLVTFFPLSALDVIIAISLLASIRKVLKTEYLIS